MNKCAFGRRRRRRQQQQQQPFSIIAHVFRWTHEKWKQFFNSVSSASWLLLLAASCIWPITNGHVCVCVCLEKFLQTLCALVLFLNRFICLTLTASPLTLHLSPPKETKTKRSEKSNQFDENRVHTKCTWHFVFFIGNFNLSMNCWGSTQIVQQRRDEEKELKKEDEYQIKSRSTNEHHHFGTQTIEFFFSDKRDAITSCTINNMYREIDGLIDIFFRHSNAQNTPTVVHVI